MTDNKNRVASFRQRLAAIGIKQRSIYVHDDDWDQVRKLADRLRNKRKKGKE